MNRIVSSIKGRIRIRDKGLRDQTKLDQLKRDLAEIAEFNSLQENVRTGSLLVRFDPNTIELPLMEKEIIAAIERVIGKPAKPVPLVTKNINRYNKLAMLASLGTSLVLLTKRRRRWRRWHALTGYAFVANLGVHLYIYRKSLFRLFR